ncbi:recombination-associated protein RdgC [Alcaligenaceae bacterium 429]|uniref:recombination-associated protein RdgC n=1 Tax=Paenalcaligenes sp. Me52 TaxID=3392038 RepID=UPI001091D56F|nr:recombination-associated protein RdgC [Alcaligenaceae bacterium 429]
MLFKNLRVYRLDPAWALDAAQLSKLLEQHQFQPGTSQDPLSLGWIEPRAGHGLVYQNNEQILLCMRSEKKLLPSTVINQVACAKATEIAEEQGYKPGRKQMQEIKEQVITELMPRAFSVARDTQVWIDPVNRWLCVDAAAASVGDEVMGLLAKTINPFPVLPLYTETSPGGAMTSWLLEDEAPANFTIDQDTELRSTTENRALVKYVRHSAEPEELGRHIQAGKQCTRLAMTWADRISFVLTDALDVKRVVPLDILTEKQDVTAVNDDEIFDADMTLMTAELAKMISDLVEALGGER